MLVNLKKLVFSRVLSHRQHLEKRPRGNMGTVCEPESSGSNSGESGASNRNRGSGRHKAAKQLKQYVKDANLEDLCSRITRGMGTDDLSALLMPKDDLEKTIVDLDDEYFESRIDDVEKLYEIVAECMKAMDAK